MTPMHTLVLYYSVYAFITTILTLRYDYRRYGLSHTGDYVSLLILFILTFVAAPLITVVVIVKYFIKFIHFLLTFKNHV